ncbi:MAG: Electron transfer flavoprotein alpha/beta-subunit [Acidimicrobiales bacterium]|nr:Electron transfer flavoprotein alpha/beta-subunit [Acidimicrobiales bacterium]
MIAVCLKWVDRRPEPATAGGPGLPDQRFAGVSAADQAALEWALRQRDASGGEVVAVTVGPEPADAVLRDAMAAGTDRAVRVDRPFDAPSRTVAEDLATVLAEATTIWCGDHSFDRGTGSVPAFLAAALEIGQALGLVAIDIEPDGIGALRRLDGGRRERLAVTGRAVLSVEGGTALLRRASLRSVLAKPVIDVVRPEPIQAAHVADARPFRPRPRAFAPPVGSTALDRIRTLTAAGAAVAHGETVTLDPPAAAERIRTALREWGYI